MRILKINSLPNSKEWVDRDCVMLHACFQLLVDYVEKENGLKHCNYETHNESIDELSFLYKWWKKRRKHIYLLEGEEDQKMIERLIKIREFLWT